MELGDKETVATYMHSSKEKEYIIGASLSDPQYCRLSMVRTSRARKFPEETGKPHTW